MRMEINVPAYPDKARKFHVGGAGAVPLCPKWPEHGTLPAMFFLSVMTGVL